MSDHFETISNRFLDPKLFYSEKIRLIASVSVSDSFLSRGTDQEWIKGLNCYCFVCQPMYVIKTKVVMHETYLGLQKCWITYWLEKLVIGLIRSVFSRRNFKAIIGPYTMKDTIWTQGRPNFPQSSFAACCERQLVQVSTFLSLSFRAIR